MNKIIIKKKFNINNGGAISLYEAFYLFLFCRHIYEREISPFENIFEIKKFINYQIIFVFFNFNYKIFQN